MNSVDLNSFLKFGYFLNYSNPDISFDFKSIKKNKFEFFDANDIITNAKTAWIDSFSNLFEKNKLHLVPISGGLDSRLILSTIIKFTDASNILTYSFGQPGTFDYDIGNFIAKKIGTNHNAINLKRDEFKMEDLIYTAKKFRLQTNLFYHPNVKNLISKYSGYTVWSGFMGDPIAGSHFNVPISNSLTQAKNKFINRNSFVNSINITNCKNDEFFKYIEMNKKLQYLSIDENLDFTNRQLKYVHPHVLFEGLKYKTPFLEKKWTNIILSLNDIKYRRGCKLYKKIIKKISPDLFSYPIKDNYGLKLDINPLSLFFKKIHYKLNHIILRNKSNYVSPFTNYMDFNFEIRNNNSVNKVVYKLVKDLENRNIIDWINFDKIWRNHLNNYANHADALITLASLEVNLKAGKKI